MWPDDVADNFAVVAKRVQRLPLWISHICMDVGVVSIGDFCEGVDAA